MPSPVKWAIAVFLSFGMGWGCALPEATHGGLGHCLVVEFRDAHCDACD